MSDFKHLFQTLKQSLTNDEFVKLTLSKPLKKGEGLINVYMRLFIIDNKQVFQLKYRHKEEEKYKQFSFDEVISEIENLLINKFRAATLFTLNEDLLVMVSKKKAVSYRENAPSFKNKLPDIEPQFS
ncbi:hypothetical protein H9W90_04220 [Polaribacter pectinis]|uniref:Uncharacterized protein n=1 Tax=Polaribacter pectinis TaxID=2738844 RepID=A0A7G9LCI8_9FLAO|nr:hypothetical protein [Polaribacter pectinis]QNM86337.1 hypothetical protein H9W90_04220 [Polaribacter pectinis]